MILLLIEKILNSIGVIGMSDHHIQFFCKNVKNWWISGHFYDGFIKWLVNSLWF